MYAPYQIPKPKNWQDLETLCLAIWRKEWNTKSFKMYGRPGQHQDGVDVFGRYDDGLELGAIQCKCKEEEKKLTETIIKAEVDKAKNFKPAIKRYVIATTFDSDAKLDTYVADLCQQNLKAGSFSIDLFGWQDIERLLELHTDIRDWYLNITKRQNQSCEVVIEEPSDLILLPVYKRTHYIHKKPVNKLKPKYNAQDILGANYMQAILQSYQDEVKVTDIKIVTGHIYHSRCKVLLSISNTSEITMKDVRVVVRANPASKFYYERVEKNLDVTKLSLMQTMYVGNDYVKYHNMDDMHPGDGRYLREFYIEPTQDVEELDLIVRVTAVDFSDEKMFKLVVNPQYYFQECMLDEKVGDPDYIEPYVEPLTK